MPYSLSNLTLLFPIACTLGVAVALTGGLVQRPQYDWIRAFLRHCVWQMMALSLIGWLFRFTILHILWIPIFIAFLVMILFWNRSAARNSIALAMLATGGAPARVNLLTRYLQLQTHGYWKRLGHRLAHAWEGTGDWVVAAYRARLIRGARPLTALALMRHTGNSDFLRTELKSATEHRRLVSRWLGRIVAASLSYLPLLAVGTLFSPALGAPLQRLIREFRGSEETWQTSWAFWVADVGFVYWLSIPLWLILLGLYTLQVFPHLTRLPPLSWLCHSYYRAITLRGLAESVRSQPQLDLACRMASQAVPVASWSSRLVGAAKRLEQGQLATSALRASGLVSSSQSQSIAMCQDAEALAWTLDDLGANDLQKINDRLSVIVQVSVVVLVLISATLALLFTSSVFSTVANWVLETVQ